MLLCWVDVETSGLDDRVDPILEVAVVVTGYDLVEQTAMNLIVNPEISSPKFKGWADLMDDTVRKMHTQSGLLRDVPFGVSARSAEEALCSVLDRVTDEPYIMAGSGIDRFDRRFLRSQMPRLAGRFTDTTSIDVGSVRRSLRDLGGREDLIPETALGSARLHRAMDDVQAYITEARVYAEYFGLIPSEV